MLTRKDIQQFSALESLANILDADDLLAMGINLEPTDSGDCFGPFAKQQEWAELDTSSEWEADPTRPEDARQPNPRTVLDLPFFVSLLLVSGLMLNRGG